MSRSTETWRSSIEARALTGQSECRSRKTFLARSIFECDVPVGHRRARAWWATCRIASAPRLSCKLLRNQSGRVGIFRDAVVMLQREVADRMTSKPGTRDWGPLADRDLSLARGGLSSVDSCLQAHFVPCRRSCRPWWSMRFRPPPVSIQEPGPVRPDGPGHLYAEDARQLSMPCGRLSRRGSSACCVEQVFERAGIDSRKKTRRAGIVGTC